MLPFPELPQGLQISLWQEWVGRGAWVSLGACPGRKGEVCLKWETGTEKEGRWGPGQALCQAGIFVT